MGILTISAIIFIFLLCNSLNLHALSFTEQKLELTYPINTDISNLCKVASSTKGYLEKGNAYDPKVIHSNVLADIGITAEKIKSSLSFICKIHKEDIKANRPSRLLNTHFINNNFKFINWQPDTLHAKKLSKNKREFLAKYIKKNSIWATGKASIKEIEKMKNRDDKKCILWFDGTKFCVFK